MTLAFQCAITAKCSKDIVSFLYGQDLTKGLFTVQREGLGTSDLTLRSPHTCMIRKATSDPGPHSSIRALERGNKNFELIMHVHYN